MNHPHRKRSWWKTTLWRFWLLCRGRWRQRYTRCAMCGTPSRKKMFDYFEGPMGWQILKYDRLSCLHRPEEHFRELRNRQRERDEEMDRRAAIRRELYLNVRQG